MKPLSLLFTSVGRRVRLLELFRDSAERSGTPLILVGTDCDAMAAALRQLDHPVVSPRSHDPEFLSFLLELCERHEIAGIFPLIDPDVVLLGRWRERFEERGIVVGGVGGVSVEQISDKWLTSNLFSVAGVPQPETWLPSNADGPLCMPCIVKPRGGSASVGVHIVHDLDQYRYVIEHTREPLAQELLTGREITIDVIGSQAGRVMAVGQRRRLAVRAGEVDKAITIWDDELMEELRKICSIIRPIGPINIQCFLSEEGPKFTEVNARFGGGVPLSILAGLDIPGILMDVVQGRPLDFHRAASNYMMLRYDAEIIEKVD